MIDVKDIKIHYFGWNNEGKSDKIWGTVSIDDRNYCFWGPREIGVKNKIMIKRYTDGRSGYWELQDAKRAKMKRGYNEVSNVVVLDEYVGIEKVAPGFTAYIINMLVADRLAS